MPTDTNTKDEDCWHELLKSLHGWLKQADVDEIKSPRCKKLFDFACCNVLDIVTDMLLMQDPRAVAWCITFIEADTRGHWQSRVRARISRRFKHCTLSAEQRARLLRAPTMTSPLRLRRPGREDRKAPHPRL